MLKIKRALQYRPLTLKEIPSRFQILRSPLHHRLFQDIARVFGVVYPTVAQSCYEK